VTRKKIGRPNNRLLKEREIVIKGKKKNDKEKGEAGGGRPL